MRTLFITLAVLLATLSSSAIAEPGSTKVARLDDINLSDNIVILDDGKEYALSLDLFVAMNKAKNENRSRFKAGQFVIIEWHINPQAPIRSGLEIIAIEPATRMRERSRQ